jgi:hypothetical protein
MEYLRDDFSELRFNAYDLKKGDDIYKKFPSLNVYGDVSVKGVDKALLFKFLNYMYDINSPLQGELDLRKRRLKAAAEAGFPRKGKRFADAYYDVATYSNKVRVQLGKAIVWFCKIHRSVEYGEMVIYERLKEEQNERLLTGALDAKETLEVLKVQRELTDGIAKLRTSFFAGDDSKDIERELTSILEFENMEFSPEQIVFSEEVRESIISGNPYGKWKWRGYSKKDLTESELEELEAHMTKNNKSAKLHFKALGFND